MTSQVRYVEALDINALMNAPLVRLPALNHKSSKVVEDTTRELLEWEHRKAAELKADLVRTVVS